MLEGSLANEMCQSVFRAHERKVIRPKKRICKGSQSGRLEYSMW